MGRDGDHVATVVPENAVAVQQDDTDVLVQAAGVAAAVAVTTSPGLVVLNSRSSNLSSSCCVSGGSIPITSMPLPMPASTAALCALPPCIT